MPAVFALPHVHDTSNGHEWIYRTRAQKNALECCRLCGTVRRLDDNNSQCKGVVRVRLRER